MHACVHLCASIDRAGSRHTCIPDSTRLDATRLDSTHDASSSFPMCTWQIYPKLQPRLCSLREVIFLRNDISHSMYFIAKGQIEAISQLGGLYRLDTGQHFGDSIVTGRRRTATHRAISSCELFLLSAADLFDLFHALPHEARLIHQTILRAHMHKEKLRTGARPAGQLRLL